MAARSADEAEERPDFVDEQAGLLERGEVTAALDLVPVAQVAEPGRDPPPGEAGDLLWEDRAAGRDAHRVVPTRAQALPVEASGRRCGGWQPVEHDVVEQLVAGERVLGVAGAVRPRPELLHDPGALACGRVDQPVAEGLRAGRLLGRGAGAPPARLGEP